jgi:hypothetical protein
MKLAMADTPTPERSRKGTFYGLGMIAVGFVGAIAIYVYDSNSMDYFDHTYALKSAILHAVLWLLGGIGVILWYNRKPNDRLPPLARDDDRDGMQ